MYKLKTLMRVLLLLIGGAVLCACLYPFVMTAVYGEQMQQALENFILISNSLAAYQDPTLLSSVATGEHLDFARAVRSPTFPFSAYDVVTSVEVNELIVLFRWADRTWVYARVGFVHHPVDPQGRILSKGELWFEWATTYMLKFEDDTWKVAWVESSSSLYEMFENR